MNKKLLIILVLFVIVNGAIFAEEAEEEPGTELELEANAEKANTFPRNTITIDATSTAASLSATLLMMDTMEGKNYFLMSALQYEYQVSRRFSTAARFGFKHFNVSDISATSLSFEGHVRFYTTGRPFFIDGELGYALFMVEDQPKSHFVTFGGKLGWRIDFGKPGGFVMEPALGYIYPIGKIKSDYSDIGKNFFIKQFFIGGFQFCISLGARF